MTCSTSEVAVCCSSASSRSRVEPRDFCFLVGGRGAARAHSLWRNAALERHRLATSRFNWFAACSGAPSHWRPLGSGQGNLAHLEVAG